nr:MAG TPA: hypothetical protein [Caudoviricetes sp.]
MNKDRVIYKNRPRNRPRFQKSDDFTGKLAILSGVRIPHPLLLRNPRN